ncbi:ABC transporter substrate-binding protein [Azospirillum sp. sgz302134]
MAGKRRRVIVGAVAGAALAATAAIVATVAGSENAADPVVLAFAGGVSTANGRTTLDAARLFVKDVNQAGGVNGRPVALEVHDDHDNAEKAQDIAYTIGQRGSAVAVIGHNGSGASLAAAPIYARFGVPAITPTATHDALTGNGWYFRTIFNNSYQARFMARYARLMLGRTEGVLVNANDAYSSQMAETVGKAAVDVGLTMRKRWPLSPDDKAVNARAVEELADFLAGTGRGAVVFLMAGSDHAKAVLTAIRDRGLDNPVIGPDVLGREAFANSFADLPRERQNPGFYTNGLFVTMPLIYDVSSSVALAFRDRFEQTYGYRPPWQSAFAYDAVGLALKAVAAKKILGGTDSVRRDREAVRDYLAGLTSPDSAFDGITGPIFFEGGGDPKKPISMGMFQSRVITPLSQLTLVSNPRALRDLDRRLERGEIVRFEDEYLYRNTIVYTGLRPTGRWEIDPDNGRFSAEFELWFRYQGDAPVADVTFPTAVEPITLGAPEKDYTVQGVTYRLYRVSGRFRLDAGGGAVPFGHHQLAISFRNRGATAERIVYVPDSTVPAKSVADLTAEFARSGFLTPGSGWTLTRAAVLSDRLPAPFRGEPDALDASVERFPYSTFATSLDVSEAGTRIRRALAVPEPGLVTGGLGLLLTGLVALDCALRRRPVVRALMPLALALAALALIYVAEIGLVGPWASRLPATPAQVVKAVDVALWLLGAVTVNALVARLAWDGFAARTGRRAPGFLRLLVSAVILIAAGLGMAVYVFQQPVTLVAAGIGLVVAVPGFAMHRQIASLIAGMAMAPERLFQVGDEVRIGNLGEGRVVEVGWRATVLATADDRVISIPNAIVAASIIDRTVARTGG